MSTTTKEIQLTRIQQEEDTEAEMVETAITSRSSGSIDPMEPIAENVKIETETTSATTLVTETTRALHR